jgi:DNA adenine methylase Dam
MIINDTVERDDKVHGKFQHPEKPPIRYAGAKSRMFKKYDVNGFFPQKAPSIFVDMFGGSGSMAMWVRERYPDVPIVFNDNNREMMQMFGVIRDYIGVMEPFNESLRLAYAPLDIPDRKKLYYDVRQKYLDGEFSGPIEESAMLLFMMRTNFNGFFGNGLKNYPDRYSGTAGTMIWKADGTLFDPKRLRKFSEALKTFVLANGDFEEIASLYEQDNAWFYADPPYRLSTTEYHEKGCADDDIQMRLIRYMQHLDSKGIHVAMSNREHHDMGDLKWNFTSLGKDHVSGLWFGDKFDSNFNITLYKHKYTSGRHNKGDGVKATEVLIKNY